MASSGCLHKQRVTGHFACDLSRNTAEPSLYSADFDVSICVECGHAEFHCRGYPSICAWLDGESSHCNDKSESH